MSYDNYTVALRVKPEIFQWRSNLITGGTTYRWFCLSGSAEGGLVVTLNNHLFRKEINTTKLEAEKWSVVACSVDVPNRKVIVFVNGKMEGEIDLPVDFKVTASELDKEETDKVWTFTDYSSATVFKGQVDELLIYGQSLSIDELEKLPLKP